MRGEGVDLALVEGGGVQGEGHGGEIGEFAGGGGGVGGWLRGGLGGLGGGGGVLGVETLRGGKVEEIAGCRYTKVDDDVVRGEDKKQEIDDEEDSENE